jgi:hypothetical protein
MIAEIRGRLDRLSLVDPGQKKPLKTSGLFLADQSVLRVENRFTPQVA